MFSSSLTLTHLETECTWPVGVGEIIHSGISVAWNLNIILIICFPHQRWQRWELGEQGDLLGDRAVAGHHLLRPRGRRHRRPTLGILCSARGR